MAERPSGRIDFVDFGKGLAILSIMLFHYADASIVGGLAPAFVIAGAGVHLFICLAGFGLTLSRYSTSAWLFYRRRFVKILVPYYVFVTLVMLIDLVHPYYEGSWYAYFGHIFWYKMLDPRIIASFGGHLWFFSTIIALYLVFPLLARAIRTLGPWRFAAAGLVVSAVDWVAVAVAGVADNQVFARFFLQYLWEFALGMALGDLYSRTGFLAWELPEQALVTACVAGLGVMAVLALLGGAVGRTFNDIPSLVGFSALVALCYRGARRFFPRENTPWRRSGGCRSNCISCTCSYGPRCCRCFPRALRPPRHSHG